MNTYADDLATLVQTLNLTGCDFTVGPILPAAEKVARSLVATVQTCREAVPDRCRPAV